MIYIRNYKYIGSIGTMLLFISVVLILNQLAPSDIFSLWLLIVIFLLSFGAFVLIEFILIYNKLREASVTLEEKCDAAPYLDLFDAIIKNARERSHSKIKAKINKSAYLFFSGRFDESIGLLLSIDKNKMNKRELLFYLNNLACAYNEKEESEKANELLKQMQALLPLLLRENSNIKFKQILDRMYTSTYNDVKVKCGQLEGCEEFYNQYLQTAESTRQRVYAKYFLGCIYLKESRIEEAKQALNYVIESGNLLYYPQKARSMLATIENV